MKSFLIANAQSQRLLFRPLVQDDFVAWLPFFVDPASIEFLGTFDGTNEERCQAWIDRQQWRYSNQNGLMALIDKNTNALVGQCGLLKQTVDDVEEIEIGYHMLPQYRRMGYASEAAIFCKHYAFDNNLCPSVISIIHPDNFKSAAVATKNRMHIEKQTTFKNEPANIFRITKQGM